MSTVNCQKCGKEIELSDNTTVLTCSNCGATQNNSNNAQNKSNSFDPFARNTHEENHYEPYEEIKRINEFNKKSFNRQSNVKLHRRNVFYCIDGIINGIISIIFGVIVMGMDTGKYEEYVTYGGDAYTGMQNAAAQTANNMVNLAEIAAFGFGALLIVMGLVLISNFTYKLIK